jgi:predicted nucleotidyltransferase
MGLIEGRTSLSDALFSGVQQRLLALLFGSPGRAFHGNELIRLAASGRGAVLRELRRLADAGLVAVERVGNQKRYQANREAPIFEELRGIVEKTFGLASVLGRALEPLAARITLAFVYGSVAKHADTARSDIDLLVVSDSLAYGELLGTLQPAEAALGRKVNPTLYSVVEYRRRKTRDSGFVARVLQQPRIPLIGDVRELAEPGKPGKDRQAKGRAARARGG